MKKYKIGIEETLVQEFEVEAKNFNEALNIAKDNYNNGEFVLSPGEVQCKKNSRYISQFSMFRMGRILILCKMAWQLVALYSKKYFVKIL